MTIFVHFAACWSSRRIELLQDRLTTGRTFILLDFYSWVSYPWMRSGKMFVLTITLLYQFNIIYFIIFWHVKYREGDGILKMLSQYFNEEIRRRFWMVVPCIWFEIRVNYQLDANIVYFSSTCFGPIRPSSGAIEFIISFTNAAYGVL